MVRSRVFGIFAGYEDQNDHMMSLRCDAVFKLLANRLPDDDDPASQPTLSHFENVVTPRSLLRLEDWFIDRFVNSFGELPREVTLDIDVFDDPPSEEGARNYLDQDIVPAEARTSRGCRRYCNRRRKADPLGGGTLVSGGCG